VVTLLGTFKSTLQEFATKHRDRINQDPEFRSQFHTMCSAIGVDPLASNKGFWADLLGVGNFYYELGILVIQICLQTRAATGGLLYLEDLLQRVRTSDVKSRQSVSIDDIKRAIEKLNVLGGGYRIIKVAGRPMLLSVPVELSTDHFELLSIAQDEGYVSEDLLRTRCGWPAERFGQVVTVLLREGIVWVDDYRGQRRFEFPSMQD
jgi:ESCRT-II complex subunit VPS22